jgi:hypothetical protein
MMDIIKTSRKKSREEEIASHGKPINYRKIVPSKKRYNRKKNKTDRDYLSYFFIANSRAPIESEFYVLFLFVRY